jgi:anaerobic magnesium-protoporphyrin IX monomethyl ester cyclase
MVRSPESDRGIGKKGNGVYLNRRSVLKEREAKTGGSRTKCLLINPPITTYGRDSPASPFFPLGLAYIAAYLEENGYKPDILDTLALGGRERGENYVRTGMNEDAIKEYIRDFDPDIVGITSMYTAYDKDAYDVARIVKEIDPGIIVVLGGAHPSANYGMVLKNENVDLVVKGEGEVTFLEIIRGLDRDEDLSDISGVITRIDGELHINPDRPFITNLDSLPFPARHLLPMDIYLSQSSPYCMRKPRAVMITSRGCPNNCIFCSIHSIWGHKWRPRSAQNVVDEIELLVKKYGVKEIDFNDDNISLDKKRMEEICDEIIKRNIDIKWTTPNGIAIWSLDESLIRKMKQSGCYRLTFGIESGNPKTQKFIRKNLDLHRARSIIKYANKIGLWTISTNIIGFPYETREEIEDTIDYSISSEIDIALFYLLTPFLGTPVHEIFKKENLIPSEPDQIKEFLVAESACDTKNFSRKELEEIQRHAYSKFMSARLNSYIKNPMKILRKISSLEDVSYVLRLFERVVIAKIRIEKYGRGGARVFWDTED